LMVNERFLDYGCYPTSIAGGRLRTASQFDHLRHILADF